MRAMMSVQKVPISQEASEGARRNAGRARRPGFSSFYGCYKAAIRSDSWLIHGGDAAARRRRPGRRGRAGARGRATC